VKSELKWKRKLMEPVGTKKSSVEQESVKKLRKHWNLIGTVKFLGTKIAKSSGEHWNLIETVKFIGTKKAKSSGEHWNLKGTVKFLGTKIAKS